MMTIIKAIWGPAVTLLAMGLANPVQAIPPELAGESVSSISAAHTITGWDRIDNQRVLVNFSQRDSYLLTLKHQCHGLAWAQNVTVTMSNNTIWAGFDSIKADGRACPIEEIQRMSRSPSSAGSAPDS